MKKAFYLIFGSYISIDYTMISYLKIAMTHQQSFNISYSDNISKNILDAFIDMTC